MKPTYWAAVVTRSPIDFDILSSVLVEPEEFKDQWNRMIFDNRFDLRLSFYHRPSMNDGGFSEMYYVNYDGYDHLWGWITDLRSSSPEIQEMRGLIYEE